MTPPYPPSSPHLDIRNIVEILIIFREGGRGGGYPFAENSAKIINLIFEPFPKSKVFRLDFCPPPTPLPKAQG